MPVFSVMLVSPVMPVCVFSVSSDANVFSDGSAFNDDSVSSDCFSIYSDSSIIGDDSYCFQ